MTIAVDLGRKATKQTNKQTKPKMFEISGSKLKFRNLTFFFFFFLFVKNGIFHQENVYLFFAK